MSWEPYVGRKVVCVEDAWVPRNGERCPVKDRTYTIRTSEPPHEAAPDDGPQLRFFEIVNPSKNYIGGTCECAFGARWFVPVDDRETDITVFERLLVGAPRELEET